MYYVPYMYSASLGQRSYDKQSLAILYWDKKNVCVRFNRQRDKRTVHTIQYLAGLAPVISDGRSIDIHWDIVYLLHHLNTHLNEGNDFWKGLQWQRNVCAYTCTHMNHHVHVCMLHIVLISHSPPSSRTGHGRPV